MNSTKHEMSAGERAVRDMDSANKTARLAGILYLLEPLTAIFTMFYVPSQIHVHGDAAATVHNVATHEFLFRLDIIASASTSVIGLLVPLALYKLLSPVSKNAAVLMVAFGVIFLPVGLAGVANQLDILSLLNGTIQQQAFTSDQLVARVMALFADSNNQVLVDQIYWGLWLVPFGYLVWKSEFLPKLLGFFLIFGCFSYLFYFVAGILFPRYFVPYVVLLPAAIGELGTALWLTFIGVRRPRRFVHQQPQRTSPANP